MKIKKNLVFRQSTIDLIKKLDRSCDFDVDIIGWQCGTPGSGPCIPLLHVCDTFPQCHPDESDETEGCNLYFGGELGHCLREELRKSSKLFFFENLLLTDIFLKLVRPESQVNHLVQ